MSGVYYNLTLAVLLVILALAAYVDRVYSEMGKFLAREYQDNIDAWTRAVEPGLWLGRESIALSASVLRQLALAAIALIAGLRLYVHVKAQPLLARVPTVEEIAVTGFFLVLLILFFDRLIPQLLFARTRGLWIAHIRLLLEALFYLILPVTLTLGLLLSIVALAEPEDAEEEEHPSEAMDALLEAGEEEGILEESDRELVRSAVEFGDKVVREVMTPRPEIFAVPGDADAQGPSGDAEGELVLAGAGIRGLAGPCDRNRVCARPAAGAGCGRGTADRGGVAAADGVCAGDEESSRTAARNAAGEAAHADGDRRVRRRGRVGDD